MTYTVLYRTVGSGRALWEQWRVAYPSRCVADAKVSEFSARGVRAVVVLTEELDAKSIDIAAEG